MDLGGWKLNELVADLGRLRFEKEFERERYSGEVK